MSLTSPFIEQGFTELSISHRTWCNSANLCEADFTLVIGYFKISGTQLPYCRPLVHNRRIRCNVLHRL